MNMKNNNWFKNVWLLLGLWTIFGIGCVILFELFLPKTSNSGSTPWPGWSILDALANWILVGGLALAIWQIYESSKNTKINSTIEFFKNLRTAEELDKLNKIYHLSTTVTDNLTFDDPSSKEIISSLENLEMLGYLVYSNSIDEELVIKAYGGVTALKIWYKIQPFVDHMRGLQGYHWGIYTEYIATIAFSRWEHQPNLIMFHWKDNDSETRKVEDIFKLYNQAPARKPRSKKDIRAIISIL
jgi:hypothetical protein